MKKEKIDVGTMDGAGQFIPKKIGPIASLGLLVDFFTRTLWTNFVPSIAVKNPYTRLVQFSNKLGSNQNYFRIV